MGKGKIRFTAIVIIEIVAMFLSNYFLHRMYRPLEILILDVILFVLTAILVHLKKYENQVELLLIPFLVAPIFLCVVNVKIVIPILLITIILVLLIKFCILKNYVNKEKHEIFCLNNLNKEDKIELYGNKSVLAIVPHQDDDINLMGGIIEEYLKYKSDIRICFYTNGDYETSAEIRLNESLKVAEFYGVSKENIIFLGYGDRWNEKDGHIYNARDDRMVLSASGKKQTYAIDGHKAYNEGAEYRRSNIISDIKSVISEYKPTDIFCIDYDCHKDHVACSLFFEEALLEILKEDEKYHPSVYKGFAYETAFFSDQDFFKLNILSTVNGKRTCYMKNRVNFNWNDRIRFPVSEESATRFIENSLTYEALKLYKSQNGDDYAESIINGDKVFWRRRTDSLLYNTKITVSSGNAEVLNDFKIWDEKAIDDFNMSVVNGLYVPDSKTPPNNGVWIPDKKDDIKKIEIILSKESDICSLVLYDNPSRSDNIVNAEISFDSGETIETGPLNPDGSATLINVNQKKVHSFTVKITDWKGENPGLSEIEAFEDEEHLPRYIKLTDEYGNFVYNYTVANGEKTEFLAYASGLKNFCGKECTLSCDNPKCSVECKNNAFIAYCPKGESCIVSVSWGGVSDSIKVSNPKDRKILESAIRFDKYFHRILRAHMQKKYYKNLLLYFYNQAIWNARKILKK